MLSHDPTYPLFPVLSFLAFALGIIPLPWHLQAWNAGTCAFMLWASLACLVEFINSVIWRTSVADVAPVWCDISTKFLLGAGIGVPASILCISRRLYSISTMQKTTITHYDKRRAMVIDLLITLGFPILIMVLHYIVQPHRYDILEDIGCHVAVYNTLPAYFIVLMWPVVLGSLTLRAFYSKRLQFGRLIQSGNPNMSISRYIRLMMLAITDMICTVPITACSMYIGTKDVPLRPWVSWEDTHFNFSRVQVFPSLLWRRSASFQTSIELTRWLFPVSALIFFALFGFASEAQRYYRMIFAFVAKLLRLNLPNLKSPLPPFSGKLDMPTKTFPIYRNQGIQTLDTCTPNLLSSRSTVTEFTIAHTDFDIDKFSVA